MKAHIKITSANQQALYGHVKGSEIYEVLKTQVLLRNMNHVKF